jgi:hypothetical protein
MASSGNSGGKSSLLVPEKNGKVEGLRSLVLVSALAFACLGRDRFHPAGTITQWPT